MDNNIGSNLLFIVDKTNLGYSMVHQHVLSLSYKYTLGFFMLF